MKGIRLLPKYASRLAVFIRLVVLVSLIFALGGFALYPAHAEDPEPAGAPVAETPSRPASGIGYVDFPYSPLDPINDPVTNDPSGEKPESKLWWNDGFWWGLLYNHTDKALKIYRLNWGTQTWEDTGVTVDARENVRADAMWDSSTSKLYVVSHVFSSNSNGGATNDNGKFRRYTYNANIQEYALDTNGAPYPKNVNSDKTETLVLAKEVGSTRIWVAYVSRPTEPALNTDYQVYVNYSSNDGNTWSGAPIALAGVLPPTNDAYVKQDDIASIVAFGDYVGVMWSQQGNPNPAYAVTDFRFRFAFHANADPVTTWTLDDPATKYPADFPAKSDDHINLKVDQYGHVLAAVKTNASGLEDPQIVLLGRQTDGNWVSRTYSLYSDWDTQPTLLVHDTENKAYLFVSGDDSGSKICYKSLALKPDLTTLGNFDGTNCGITFLEDATFTHFNKPTSMKGNVSNATGIVVLATDNYVPLPPAEEPQHVYGHGRSGDPAPVITARTPYFNAANVSVINPVTVTFSHSMNPDTITNSTFTLKQGATKVEGAVTYDLTTWTATFTPSQPLKANTVYTAAVTTGAKDLANHALYNQPANTWSFTTEPPVVQFSLPNYSELEDAATAVITATLSTSSSMEVEVNYTTIAGGTAVEGVNYQAASGKLTFAPGEVIKTFNVTLFHNLVAEGNKTVNLELSGPVGANLGAQALSVLTIIDAEQSSVQFAPESFDVDEDAGNAEITVQLSHANAADVIVHVATSDGTGVAGSDYSAVSTDLTIPAGETIQTFNVPILDDALDEADETVTLTLSSPSDNAVLGVPGSTAVLTIKDNDSPVQASFTAAAYSVKENAGKADITVKLGAASGQTVLVNYATIEDTGKSGVDFSTVSGTLTFQPGQTSLTFSVPILDNPLTTRDATVKLALSLPQNANAALGSPSSSVLTIQNTTPHHIYIPLLMDGVNR